MPLFDDHHGVVGPAERPQRVDERRVGGRRRAGGVGDEIVDGEDVVLDACGRRARDERGGDGDSGGDLSECEHRAPFGRSGSPRTKDVRASAPRGFAPDISCAAERQGPVAQPVFKTGTPA